MLLGGGLNQFVSQGFICKKIKNLSNNELKLNRYEAKTRRDIYIYGGGLIEFVSQGIICEKIKDMNLTVVSVSVLSLQLQRKSRSDLVNIDLPQREAIFKEMNKIVTKVLRKYKDLIVMGNFNIDVKSSNAEEDKLENFYDLFNLTNLVYSETCFMKNSKSIIYLISTNKPLHFQKLHFAETGLSDYHKLISIFFKVCSSKLILKLFMVEFTRNLMNQISYAVSKKQISTFLKNDPNQNCNLLTDKSISSINKHASLKMKFVKGNNAPLMNREIQKEIYGENK